MWRDVLRALVSVLGTLPGATLSAAAVASAWPGRPSVGYSVGFVLTLPLWVLAMTVALLDAKVWRASFALALWTAAAVLAVRLG